MTITIEDISPHFIRSVRKDGNEVIITIKGECLRDDWFDDEDTDYDYTELMEQDGVLYGVDWNHQAFLTLSDEVVQKYKDDLQPLIDEGLLERNEEDEEWVMVLGQFNPITPEGQDEYNISEEGLLTYYEVPQKVWEHLGGSWCNG